MIVPLTPKESLPLDLSNESNAESLHEEEYALNPFKTSNASLVPNRISTHNPKAGLNPLVDAAGYLLSVIGKLKQAKTYRQLNKLQKELIHEINLFNENAKNRGYNTEYLVVCRYVLCATFDDILCNLSWGAQGQWETYSLLTAFNQDVQHQDKFFTILERAIKEPAHYIDLMELMYICLSIGYKGQYRSTEHSQYQLEQIINNLYKHIRAHRGSFSKILSPMPLKSSRMNANGTRKPSLSMLFIFSITACIIMAIFVSLGYIMDVISNEAYQHVAQINTTVPHATSAA